MVERGYRDRGAPLRAGRARPGAGLEVPGAGAAQAPAGHGRAGGDGRRDRRARRAARADGWLWSTAGASTRPPASACGSSSAKPTAKPTAKPATRPASAGRTVSAAWRGGRAGRAARPAFWWSSGRPNFGSRIRSLTTRAASATDRYRAPRPQPGPRRTAATGRPADVGEADVRPEAAGPLGAAWTSPWPSASATSGAPGSASPARPIGHTCGPGRQPAAARSGGRWRAPRSRPSGQGGRRPGAGWRGRGPP